MTNADEAAPANGPVRPTIGASVVHRPIDGLGARLTTGLLSDWQRRNRSASLPLALRQLEAAGNLANVRLAIAGVGGSYRGPVFMDSDIYKTLEAISWEQGREPSAELAEFVAETTALLASAQQADGYLNSYKQVSGNPHFERLESSHELYCAGHLIQAAVAASRTFDGGALLGVATGFADLLVSRFLGTKSGLDGHPIVETALVELYRETGTAEYLQLAKQFVDQRGYGLIGDSGFGIRYLQDHLPIRESPTEVGHAVRALYLESGVADVAVETGDEALLATSVARWEDMVATKTALTGGNGSRHSGEAFGDAYELPPDRAYNETCAAIASFHWSWRMLLATGNGKYVDLMERILYNGFGGSTATGGQRFFYVNPLQRRIDHFEDDDPGRRREWFSCACCPPNIMRLVASLGHYLATTSNNALYVHLLTGSQLTGEVAGGQLTVDVATDYPWSGSAELTVRGCPDSECGLAVRVPGWSRLVSVQLNGEPVTVDAHVDADGYLVVRRQWRPGDVLACTLDLKPRLTFPNRRIDALRATVAVERGPLVYCFEQADQADGVDLEDLAVDSAIARSTLTERTAELDGIGKTVVIEAGAFHLPTQAAPYSEDGTAAGGSGGSSPRAGTADGTATAVAIPYFQWDNRDGRAMRIWLPLAPASPTNHEAEVHETHQGG
ncbi:MAG TPA: beta-L-arabinofuranosidase domain-containing protein [Streptosporangiaceae bacterium]|nr:beta-L-arabinofuranosidase domain-containing protein [Streptosporangiaceae bacterium]